MSPTHSRAFHAVATAGSFTAAAKALNVSQPTVTTQVKELETLYGVELFHRHPRGVTLTDAGKELLVIIRRMYAGQQDAIQYLQTVQDLHTGHLRVGSYGPYSVIQILAAFTQRYPHLTFALTFANSRKLRDELHNHNLDVAVFTQLQTSPEFHSLAYVENKMVLIVGKSHPWRDRKTTHLGDIEGERLIIREPGSEARRATEETILESGVTPANIIEIGSREGIVAAVAQGVGISMIFDEGFLPDHLVTKIRIRGADLIARVDVVCLAERKSSRILGCFFEIAEELLAARH